MKLRPALGAETGRGFDTTAGRKLVEDAVAELLIRDGLVRGGFAEVYRGLLEGRDGVPSDVAVHVLRVRHEPGMQHFDRVAREASLLVHVRHPAVV